MSGADVRVGSVCRFVVCPTESYLRTQGNLFKDSEGYRGVGNSAPVLFEMGGLKKGSAFVSPGKLHS